jgi:hypothetical protein
MADIKTIKTIKTNVNEKTGSKILAINCDKSSVTSIDCAEFELELKRTQLELKSAEEIVDLLREKLVGKATIPASVGVSTLVLLLILKTLKMHRRTEILCVGPVLKLKMICKKYKLI